MLITEALIAVVTVVCHVGMFINYVGGVELNLSHLVY